MRKNFLVLAGALVCAAVVATGLSAAASTKEPIWVYAAKDQIWTTPRVEGALAFFGADDDAFRAVDIASGREAWRFATGDAVRGSAALDGGLVYFCSYDGFLYALDAEKGAFKWKARVVPEYPEEETAFVPPRSVYDDYGLSPAAAGGKVYCGSSDAAAGFSCFDGKTGKRLWNWNSDTADWISGAPLVAGEKVYVCGGEGAYCFDAARGTLLWRFSSISDNIYAPTLADGVLYYCSKDTYVHALDAATGEPLWATNLSGTSWANGKPAVLGSLLLCSSSDGRALHALDRSTGRVLWERKGDWYNWTDPVAAGTRAYMAFGEGTLVALDFSAFAAEGAPEELWSSTFPDRLTGSPALAGALVLQGCLDGKLYAFRAE